MVHRTYAEIEVEYIDPEMLKPAVYNPRKISEAEMKKLIRSIKQFGLVDPIIINHDNTVIGGHRRLEAARILGLEEVPVVRLNLSENDAKLLNLALNKISGEWDEDRLMNLLAQLNKDGVDLSLSGFSDSELEEFVTQLETISIEELLGEVKPAKETPPQWAVIMAEPSAVHHLNEALSSLDGVEGIVVRRSIK